jgi:hypothetical protein
MANDGQAMAKSACDVVHVSEHDEVTCTTWPACQIAAPSSGPGVVCISKREGECKQFCNQEGAVRRGLARCTVGSQHHRLVLEPCVSISTREGSTDAGNNPRDQRDEHLSEYRSGTSTNNGRVNPVTQNANENANAKVGEHSNAHTHDRG